MPFADASTSEKPGAIVPHAGICAGAVGQLAVLPQWQPCPCQKYHMHMSELSSSDEI